VGCSLGCRLKKGPPKVTIELILQVTRSAENRLSGTVRSGRDPELHHFSGTLELMRVFEDLVPFAPEAGLPASTGAAGPAAQPKAAQPPHPQTP
jgi:hypothetical protein